MIVPSFPFLAFAIGAALLYNLPISFMGRKLVLLIANLLFIASFAPSPVTLAPFAAFILLGYAAIHLARATRSSATAGALLIGGMVLLFAWLKKYGFLAWLGFLPFPYVAIGLSYVFFRVLHLVIDAAQGSLKEVPAPLDYGNYALNFLAFVSGPIQRYEDYQAQQREAAAPGPIAIVEVAERVALGMFKVVVLSMLLIEQHKLAVADLSLDQDLPARIGTVLQVLLVYPLYLYANFSGYCDVVIALGRLFRLRMPENFDRPFFAENFIIFWSRWHMTLSNWLKTYVYSPMMMAMLKRTSSPDADAYLASVAFFATFFLIGVWHGQTSEFLFYGLLHGGSVAVNKLYQTAMIARLGRKPYRQLAGNPWYAGVSRGITFTWFSFTLLWFWADWATIALIGRAAGVAGVVLVALLAISGSAMILSGLAAWWARHDAAGGGNRYVRTMQAAAMLTALWLVSVILSAPAPDIVYKTF